MKQELPTSWAVAWQQFGGIALSALRIVGILLLAWVGLVEDVTLGHVQWMG